MLQRETNRAYGSSTAIAPDTVEGLRAAAQAEGARLHILDTPTDIEAAASLLAAADRIRYHAPTAPRDVLRTALAR